MLSLLERDLLSEVLSTRFPGTSKQQIDNSIRTAESVVIQAAQSAVQQQSSPSYQQQSCNQSNNSYNLPTVNQQQEGWGIKFGSSSGVSTPIGGANTSFGVGIFGERGVLDDIGDALGGLVKPVCQATATAVYNAAIGAAAGLDPISQAAATAVAKAAYDKAMKQC